MQDDDREQTLRERAYALWEAEGRPAGRHEQHWHQAVAETAEEQPAATTEKPASAPKRSRQPRAVKPKKA